MNWPFIKQLWVVCGVVVDYVGHGMVLSFSSCLLDGLSADDSPIKLDLASSSWLGSIFVIIMGPTILIISFLMEKYGRRWVHAAAVLADLIAWLLQYWATDLCTLLIARTLAGVSTASGYVCGCTIIAEYTSPEHRGIFLILKTVATVTGYLITHTSAHYLHWRTVALMGVIPCVLGLISNLTWPESPSWLVLKNRFVDCEKAYYSLRGRSDEAIKELEAMIRAQKLRVSKRPECVHIGQKIRMFLEKFKDKSFLKPLFITLCCAIVKEASGRHFFPSYAVDIMRQITNDKANRYLYIIIIDIVMLTSTLVSCILIKVMGRRTLFALSGIPAIVLLLVLSSVLFAVSRGMLSTVASWLVPSLVCVLFMVTNLGCTGVSLVIFGEIFPLPHRECGLAVGGCVSVLIMFLNLKIVPYMLTYLQLYGTFAVYAVAMTVGMACLYYILPETKNKTLQEIEDIFAREILLDDKEKRDVSLDEFLLSNRKDAHQHTVA